MPKLLILFHSRTGDTARLADAVADGARSVRFAEVDVRRISDASADAGADAGADAAASWSRPASAYRALDDAASLGEYDAIVIGLPSGGDTSDSLGALITRVEGKLTNKVGSVFTPGGLGAGRDARLWSVLAPMADREMILVPPRPSQSEAEAVASAHRLGKRVAEVVSWVTHARSHHHHH